MNILTNIQQNLLREISQVRDSRQFYLTGGTALARFYLGHRCSEDLDFFTGFPDIITPFSVNLEKHLNEKGYRVKRLRGVSSFIELEVISGQEGVLVHLAQDAAFRLQPLKSFEECPGLNIDSLEDIAANKLLALFGRAMLRDFIDVYFLVNKGGFSKKKLTDSAAKKDPGFDLYWLGVALERVRSFDQKAVDMLLLIEKIDFSDIRDFFTGWLKEIAGIIKASKNQNKKA